MKEDWGLPKKMMTFLPVENTTRDLESKATILLVKMTMTMTMMTKKNKRTKIGLDSTDLRRKVENPIMILVWIHGNLPLNRLRTQMMTFMTLRSPQKLAAFQRKMIKNRLVKARNLEILLQVQHGEQTMSLGRTHPLNPLQHGVRAKDQIISLEPLLQMEKRKKQDLGRSQKIANRIVLMMTLMNLVRWMKAKTVLSNTVESLAWKGVGNRNPSLFRRQITVSTPHLYLMQG
mmetsp:Transcript_26188/g.71856  ORF Transcript_26188/g.71856 Transcript_26188/m.71856 type:complete len:232 (-) Transcript_26188:1218-1913(-)